MPRTSPRVLFALTAATMLTAGSALAATEQFTATLVGASEVPPNDSKGTGTVTATYDTATKKFGYDITYQGLTGPATAAHFHGPAAPGTNAPPVVPIPPGSLATPIKGEATLTDTQASDLESGKWYFNVHTAAHGPGEIRGQVVKK